MVSCAVGSWVVDCSWDMTGSSWGEGDSLKAQRFDRSEGGGAGGGVGAEEQAGERCRTKGEEDRIGGDFRMYSGDLERPAEHADEHAGEAADQRHEHGLGQELGEYARASGADRLADPDLA